ncbi:MAG TPA: hypothetical protein VGR85_14220 [Candidatus Limnocylindria bacterium]|jgi:hypothetical protein|nr:hypothetical protein [Candidatus Limnocylindria bacterium]
MTWSDRRIAIALAAAGAVAYVVAGLGLRTDYDYYGRLAQALLEGHWWVSEAPPWLNELVPCGAERWCVVYPPLPAILAMPLAVVLPTALSQVIASRIAGGASAGILFLALRAFGAPRLVAIAGALLSTFGTTLFFSSVDGRAWYAAHAVAMPFLSASFLFAARGERAWLVGACIGLAALARLPVAAAAPALALLLARRADTPYPRALAGVVLGGVPFALMYVGWNVLRWDSVFDAGYVQLTQGDVFFTRGLFSPFYLPRHFYAIFLEPPDLVEGTPFFLRPRGIGTALFLTTPAFLWLFAGLRGLRRDIGTVAVALAALLALLPDILHGTVGFQQFGYRFSIDAQPFLIALALVGDARHGSVWRPRPSWLFVAVVVVSVAINLYAMVAITRFDYWQ